MIQFESIFSIGFRPFFLLASLVAVINPTFWISSFAGYSEINPQGSPLFWHSHEMVFGFTSALIAGFLLTASANWTGTKPYSGAPLAILVLFWIIERISFFLGLPDLVFMIVSNIFLPLFIILLATKLNKFPAQKYVFLPFLIALALAKFLHSYGFFYSIDIAQETGLNSGVALIRFLLFLIAGRVLPFFTRKKLSLKELSIPNYANIIALTPLILLATPLTNYELTLVPILILAILGNAHRNYLMFVKGALKVPMLWVLHLGINFLLLGLILELLSVYFPGLNQNKEVLHTTMAGGLSIVAIGIMTRVSLGHTGRDIKATRPMVFAYLSVAIGALIRIIIPITAPNLYESSLHYASGFWTLGFLYFFFKFSKILWTPRPDGK